MLSAFKRVMKDSDHAWFLYSPGNMQSQGPNQDPNRTLAKIPTSYGKEQPGLVEGVLGQGRGLEPDDL